MHPRLDKGEQKGLANENQKLDEIRRDRRIRQDSNLRGETPRDF